MKVVKEENLELKEKEGKGRERSVGKGEYIDVWVGRRRRRRKDDRVVGS